MSQVDERVPISLTVLDRGDALALLLTDARQLAKLATIAAADALLGNVRRDLELCRALSRPDRSPLDRGDPDVAWRAFGSRLYSALLPEDIGSALRDVAPGALMLQLDPALAWLPWELAFDGESFVGERFRVSRQIVAERRPAQALCLRPRQGPLRVLVLAGVSPGAADEPAAQGLVARLRAVHGLAISAAPLGHLQREDLVAAAGASDVVHYIGPTDSRAASGDGPHSWRNDEPLDIAALATLGSVPQLLVVQNTAVSAAATVGHGLRSLAADGLGSALIGCEAGASPEHAVELMSTVYTSLLRGFSAGEALRTARVALHQRFGLARLAELRPELYGDGGWAVFAPERLPRADDNVRQVTTMSIDLVDSTRLMGAMGAELYSDLLAEYYRRSASIFRAFDGMSDLPQGDDGYMCYFGLPLAREDAAVQALRAGLELIEVVKSLGLGVRIGVCTGEVVVRDGQPYGESIHFAARLQKIAEPGTMLVGELTRRIAGNRFRFEGPLAVVPLKGFDSPEPYYRAVDATPAVSADPADADAKSGLAMTPFVGRRVELHTLKEHWAAVCEGSLHVVRIVGEAGIGKSRLVRELKRTLVAQGHTVFECRCLPEHSNSAFRPLIDALRAELRIGSGEDARQVLERLRDLVIGVDEIDQAAIALIADLLSVELPVRHAVLGLSAERRRELTVDVGVTLARRLVRDGAACLIVEDVHWIDPSTGEYLNRLVQSAQALPLMVLVSSRSDVDSRWQPRTAVHEIEMHGLSPDLSRALVAGACGAHPLPNELVHLIAARADGVPLFIEESTRMAVELGVGDGGAGAAKALPVPTTLLDLLTARLDRLGGAKQVAQVGGTIGREFSLALLQAVLENPHSPFAASDLPERLAALQRSGILLARIDGEGPRFAFKHALMRDAAYRSLLERDRLRLHQVVASVIGEQFRELAEQQPELLAYHYTEAGLEADALRCWESAARQAASRSAHAEAISHVRNALSVLLRRPPGADRDRMELRLQLLLAARLIAMHGYGAESVERIYSRAMQLAQALGDEGAQMRVLLGLEGYHFMRADFAQARACLLDAAARVDLREDAFQAIQSQWALANIAMHQGEMEAAVRQMDDCLARYGRLEHRPAAVQDPGVMCLCYSAWSMWQLGFPDQALQRVVEVVQLAERMEHKFSLGEAYGFRAAVHLFRGETRAAHDSADRAVAICEDGGFAVWLAHAHVMRGRALADLGDCNAGIEEMRKGFELWAATGAVVTTPFYLTMRAEGLALAGRPEEGLTLLEHALSIVERTGERYYEAEIRRLIGQVTLQVAARAGLDRSADAEQWMLQALECAQARKLLSLALRAAMGLAGLWLDHGRRQAAERVLRTAYDAITEGRETRDLVTARSRLAVLSAEAAP